MIWNTFQKKLNKHSKEIQKVLSSIAGTKYVNAITSDRESKHFAHFETVRKWADKEYSAFGTNVVPRVETRLFYTTFSKTDGADGKLYCTLNAELPLHKDVTYVLLLPKCAYSFDMKYILENSYVFGEKFGKKRAVDCSKLTPIFYGECKEKAIWDAKYIPFARYSTHKEYGRWNLRIFRDKNLTNEIEVNVEGSNGVDLYRHFVSLTNADYNLSTFQAHFTKALNNGEEVFKLKNKNTGAILYVKIEGSRLLKEKMTIAKAVESEKPEKSQVEIEKEVEVLVEKVGRRKYNSIVNRLKKDFSFVQDDDKYYNVILRELYRELKEKEKEYELKSHDCKTCMSYGKRIFAD